MKVDIKRGEGKVGMVFKKPVHTVTVQVVFSEQEKEIIKQTNISGNIVCQRPVRAGQKPFQDDDIWHLRVHTLLKGQPDTYEFFELHEANSYYDALLPSLKNLKQFIENNSIERGDQSVEL